ncbi:MAG: chemotaxis protein CheW [Candidatus Uhrbacteria bacterium]
MDTSNIKQVIAAVAAEVKQGKKKVEDTVQLVIFTLDNEEYGVPINDLQEIIKVTEVTPIPGAPEFIRGILNLRGKIVVVVDLEKRFHLTRTTDRPSGHIIITEVAESTFGVIVDQVAEVLRVPVSQIQPTPAVVSSKIQADYLNGVVVIEEKKQQLVPEECTQEVVDSKKKSTKSKVKGQGSEVTNNSRLIVLIDLPKMLQDKDLLSVGSTVAEVVKSN